MSACICQITCSMISRFACLTSNPSPPMFQIAMIDKTREKPSVYVKIAIENGPVEIMDLHGFTWIYPLKTW